jgi:predicted esterase
MPSAIHETQPVLQAGKNPSTAERGLILLHGRGGSARDMLPLAEALLDEDTAVIIPQAAHHRWYPQTAFGPLEVNQPDLNSALNTINRLMEDLISNGIPRDRIFLGGFSQGACLAAEYAARNPGQFGGVFVLSGALIGPSDQERESVGSLQGTPVFIGCSDIDPWIPFGLVQRTAAFFRTSHAAVDLRVYPGMGHTVNEDEINSLRDILAR